MTIILTFVVATVVWIGSLFGIDSKDNMNPQCHYGEPCPKAPPADNPPDNRKPF